MISRTPAQPLFLSYQRCGCVSPYQWSARSIVLPDTNRIIEAPLCNIVDRCYPAAASELADNVSIWDKFCSDCKQACSSVDFVVTPSSVAAPSVTYAKRIKDFVEGQRMPRPSNWTTNWQTEVRNNFVGMDVVCQSLLVENLTQESTMKFVDVLSNVGGHTGLWIGISFLSIMEFVEMLYRLTRYQYHVLSTHIRKRINGNSG